MTLNRSNALSEESLMDILASFPHEETISVVRVRYKNKLPIKRTEQMALAAFKELIRESIETGWGADVEIYVPSLDKTLIGHHDGVFWLE